jgi:hypothetical protein
MVNSRETEGKQGKPKMETMKNISIAVMRRGAGSFHIRENGSK